MIPLLKLHQLVRQKHEYNRQWQLMFDDLRRKIIREGKGYPNCHIVVMSDDRNPTALGEKGKFVSRPRETSKTQRYVCSTFQIEVGIYWIAVWAQPDVSARLISAFHTEILGVTP